jgi:hypothetical protein
MRGRTVVVARLVGLSMALLTVALYGTGVWVWGQALQGPCPLVACPHAQVPPAQTRAFAALHLTVGVYSGYYLGLNLLFALGFAAVAALLVWRRSHDPLALLSALALLLFALGAFEHGVLLFALTALGPGWQLPVALLSCVGELAFGLFVVVFPDGRFVPRWTRVGAPVALTLWWGPTSLFPGSPLDFTTWPALASFSGWAVLLGTLASAQVYRYRRGSTAAQRLQTKWVVYGLIAAGAGYFAGHLVLVWWAPALTSPQAVLADLAGYTLAYLSILLIPTCIGSAILRYRLYDIDVIIRRTVIYSLVTGTLGSVFVGSSIVLQAGFQALTGQGSMLAVVGATLALAALVTPVRRQVQARIDRRFYRSTYDAARTVAAFSARLRSELDLDQVTADLVAVVQDTLQPRQVSLWLAPPRRSAHGEAVRQLHVRAVDPVRIPTPSSADGHGL